jgi:large subunit ribosomal protein L17
VRHQRTGKKLGRDASHRRALYANLAAELIEHERIKTTVTKAKAVKPIAEQMITLGRRGDMHARRQAVAFLRSKDIVHKLFTELGPRYAERPGGYSRIVRLGPRPGDGSEMVYLELVDTPLVFKTRAPADGAQAQTTDVQPAEAEAAAIETEEPAAEEAEEPAADEADRVDGEEVDAAGGEPAEAVPAEAEGATAEPDAEAERAADDAEGAESSTAS